jgi:outer membrane receptor protein involved in Fe transport
VPSNSHLSYLFEGNNKEIKMTTKIIRTSLMAVFALASLQAEQIELDPIVVDADFREQKLSQTGTAMTVLGEGELYDKASQPFIETLGTVPNVNYASGASKAKYIQIRGIGERSQFRTPINPSVGVIVDGIDFSNITLGLSSFDVKQVEVLKGPQGTTFGANGLAGVVSIQSNEATKETTGNVEVTAGNYNTKSFGAAVGGTLVEDKLIGRVSVYKNESDGFMKNSHLNREDTNNIDELTAKTHLRFFANDNHTIDLNYIHTDVKNGYDAFTLDNSRTSHADEPGKDTQKTDAVALKSTYEMHNAKVISTLSHSKSDMTYSYDEDWSYVGEFSDDLWPYSSFDEYNRERTQTDIDVRMVSNEKGRIFNGSTDWTFGAYYKDATEDLVRNYTYLGAPFSSSYETQNSALYGQLDSHFNSKLTLTTGVRVEKWKANYSDSDTLTIDTDEVLVGGKIGLKYQANASQLFYTTLSRGYKPGGVNADNTLPNNAREFKTETLWNLDIGCNGNYLDGRLMTRSNLFVGKRQDQQVKSSLVQTREDGSTDFTDYLANAAKATYYGVEGQIDYRMTDALSLYASLGLLKSEFDEYNDPNPSAVDVNGRAPAHAPEYQYSVGFNYNVLGNLYLKANVEGKDSFYFSNRHHAKSESYQLVNAAVEYVTNDFTVTLWGKNLTDETYDVRGFGSFGNNPAKGYMVETYTQKGAPRTFGLTLGYHF